LLWPTGLSDQLTDTELEAILTHELCHVDRRDNLSALVQMIVETVFWFYPVVWWLGARLLGERERACDEEVLQMGNERRSYAEGILKVCGFCLRSPLTCVSGVGGSDLTQRIEQIMTRATASPLTISGRLLLGGVGVLLISAPLAAGALNAHRVSPTTTDRAVAPTSFTQAPAQDAPKVYRLVYVKPKSKPKARDTRIQGSGIPEQAAAQDSQTVYRKGDDITLPKVVYEVKPLYTRDAMRAGIQGSIALEAVVLEDGTVGDVEVVRSLDTVYGLDNEAVKALKQWRFEPGTKDKKPVKVRCEVEMSFKLK
jgi:TonB family protein